MSNIWQPLSTLKDVKVGDLILGWCLHDANTYIEDPKGLRLTSYGAHCEGLSRVSDGPHVLEWGGFSEENDWELGIKITMPNWWFLYGSDFEVVANPVLWIPITPPLKEEIPEIVWDPDEEATETLAELLKG